MPELNCAVFVERLEDDYAVLKTESGEEFFFPTRLLHDIKEGDKLLLNCAPGEAASAVPAAGADHAALAKAILNEIFSKSV